MRLLRQRLRFAVALIALSGPVLAQPLAVPPPGAVAPGALGAVTTACWLDYRYFRTLSAGVLDYCRSHLRFEPGALDCYQYTDRVCSVFLPGTAEWIETRQTVAPVVFPCPDGPEPPVCPRLR